MELIFGYLISKEVTHYFNFGKIKQFIFRKKYWDIDTDSEWFKNYILNEISEDELKIWIRNVFNSKKKNLNDNNYYKPIGLENISRTKMIKWVSYNIYYKSTWQLSKIEINEADKILSEIEKKIKFKFNKLNENNELYFLKFGSNRIECSYRPYLIHSCLGMLKDLCFFSLYLFNFDMYSIKNTGIIYFHYNKHKNDKNTTIFIHGLGFGIEPYLYYILRLRRKMNLIIIILPNISNMDMTFRRASFYSLNSIFSTKKIHYDDLFPEYNTWRLAVKYIIQRQCQEESKINIIAHSFGTVIMGLLLKDKWIQKKVFKKILIEPVCFIDKSYKIYRYINEPKEGNYGYLGKIFNNMIYKDIYLRYVTQRFLYGPEFWILDYDNFKNNSLVIISENDQVVPTDQIYERMKKHDIECIYLKEAFHADMFMSSKYDKIFDHMDNYILSDLIIEKN